MSLGMLDSNTVQLSALEPIILQTAEEIRGLKESKDMLKKNHNSLVEQSHVLSLGKEIYQTQASFTHVPKPTNELDRMASVELMSLSEFGEGTSSMLGQVAGMITREHTASLERVIFRATRGNAVFRSIPVPEPLLDTNAKSTASAEYVDKDFFMVFFAGEVLKDKISKIASYFGASLYKFPESTADHNEMTDEVARRIGESQEVMARGSQVMRELLVKVGEEYPTWSYVVAKEKMSYHALNMCDFDIKKHVFTAEMWVPKARYGEVEAALRATALENGLDTRPIINRIKTTETPPTHIPVTSFSLGFQALVNTYGTPRYRECNPGAFCCIMFPFLFGIMFGDFGHGFLLACFGFWLRSKEAEWEGKTLNDMVQMCYGGRYVILLNGLFGMYVGLCYNEAFAFPMNFFGGTRWMDRLHAHKVRAAAACLGAWVHPRGRVPTAPPTAAPRRPMLPTSHHMLLSPHRSEPPHLLPRPPAPRPMAHARRLARMRPWPLLSPLSHHRPARRRPSPQLNLWARRGDCLPRSPPPCARPCPHPGGRGPRLHDRALRRHASHLPLPRSPAKTQRLRRAPSSALFLGSSARPSHTRRGRRAASRRASTRWASTRSGTTRPTRSPSSTRTR